MSKVKQPKHAGEIVNQTQLVKLLGVARLTIQQWEREGCPVEAEAHTKGVAKKYDTAKVAHWLQERAFRNGQAAGGPAGNPGGGERKDLDALKARKLEIENEIAEIELRKAQGEVVEVAPLVHELSGLHATLRQRIRNVPRRVVPLIVAEPDERRIFEVLIGEIDAALSELSNVDNIIEQPGGDPAEAPADLPAGV